MRRQKDQIVVMTEGPVFSELMQFFIPITLGSLIMQLYHMVDSVVLGKLVGKTALAAVGGSSVALINLVLGFFGGLSSGMAVVVSQHYGAGEDEEVGKAVHTSMLFSAFLGAVISVAGILLARPLLRALDTPEDIMQYSTEYIQWYFAGMMPLMIYNMGFVILRGIGESRRPLIFLLTCAVLNTVLDLLFVGVFKMEVAGAAIATSLSQVICTFLMLRTLSRLDNACRFEIKKLCFEPQLLRRMLLIGVPSGLQSVLYNVANLVLQRAINLLGTDSVAAWAIVTRIDGFYWTVDNSIGIAVMTFVGQNYGARKKDRIDRCVRQGLWFHLAFSVAFGLGIYLAKGAVAQIFSSDPVVIEQAGKILLYLAAGYPTFVFTEIYSSAMRGCGNAVKPTLLTLFGVCVLRLTILFVYTFPHLSNFSVAICYPATWVISSILFILYYKFGKWMPEFEKQTHSL